MLNRYEITDDRHRIDLRAVHEFMSDVSWGRWRTHEIIEQQVTQAWRVVTAHTRSDAAMVGFARAFSDGVSVAYLADVYVSPQHRGHGLGMALIDAMIESGPGQSFKWMLHTHDAHGLYAKFGFKPATNAYLERPSPLAPPLT